MRLLILLTLLTLLTACGDTETQGQGIDEDIQPVLIELQNEYYLYTGQKLEVSIPITFKELDFDLYGACHSRGEIFINPSRWPYLDNEFRKIILLHEIGHCMFGLDHEDNKESIMFPMLSSLIDRFNADKESYYTQFPQPNMEK